MTVQGHVPVPAAGLRTCVGTTSFLCAAFAWPACSEGTQFHEHVSFVTALGLGWTQAGSQASGLETLPSHMQSMVAAHRSVASGCHRPPQRRVPDAPCEPRPGPPQEVNGRELGSVHGKRSHVTLGGACFLAKGKRCLGSSR